MDWIDSDMPFEGAIREESLGFLADRSVPTCRPDEPAAAARARLGDLRAGAVLNEEGVLLGLLPNDGGDRGRVIDVMVEGPSTWRPHVTATEILPFVERRGPDEVVVTTLEGKLVGVVPTQVLRSTALGSG